MSECSQIYQNALTSSSSSRSSSSPLCLLWARKLTFLLEDREGVEIFKKYVEAEGGIHSDRLNFYFACEGLKQQNDSEKVKQIVGAIYRFLKKSQLHIPEGLKQTIKLGLKDKNFIFTPDLFDQMQQDVEKVISETTYRNFLQSDTYINYVDNSPIAMDRNYLLANSNSSSSNKIVNNSTSEETSFFLTRSSTLPTLHEEVDSMAADEGVTGVLTNRELPLGSLASKIPMSLTLDALMATQQRRLEMRPPG